MISKVLQKAEEILRREHLVSEILCPYGTPPMLTDLWPVEQDEYIARAEKELGIR